LALCEGYIQVRDQPRIYGRRNVIRRDVDPDAGVIGIGRGVIAELMYRHTAATISKIPTRNDRADPMSHVRENRHFTLNHVACGCFAFLGDLILDWARWLHSDDDVCGLNFERFRLSNHKWLVLRDFEWGVLSNVELRISDTYRDLGRCITPEERDAPGDEKYSGSNADGANSNADRVLEQTGAQIGGI
jgi:hypothetical protein